MLRKPKILVLKESLEILFPNSFVTGSRGRKLEVPVAAA